MKVILIFVILFSVISCGKKEPVSDGSSDASAEANLDEPKYTTVDGTPGTGRLGISENAAIDLWGNYTKANRVPPAEKALLFKPSGFVVGVQIWKGKVAQIRVSKGKGMPEFDKEELLQLCGKMTGAGKWKLDGFEKVRQDGRVFMLNYPSLPRFRTAEFEAAVNRAEKKTKAKAIDDL